MPADDVDEELAKAVVVAKKKPRNFALFSKGANVLKLLLSKKPIKDEAILKTKKDVQANTILRGVVQGEGADLVFQVLEEPSVAEAKLKKFLSESTGLMLKPCFKIVASLPEVDEDDDDNAQAAPATPAAAETGAGSGAQAEQLLETVNKLTPMIKQAVADFPARKAEILAPLAAFQTSIKANDLAQAKECVMQLGALLKSLKSQTADTGKTTDRNIPFADALSKWRSGQATIKSNIAAFQKALLVNEEVKSDPRIKFVAAAVAEIPNMLPGTGRQVDAVLSAGVSLTDKQKALDVANLALKAINNYRNELVASSQLDDVEQFAQVELRTPLLVLEPLRGVIGEIEVMIRSAI